MQDEWNVPVAEQRLSCRSDCGLRWKDLDGHASLGTSGLLAARMHCTTVLLATSSIQHAPRLHDFFQIFVKTYAGQSVAIYVSPDELTVAIQFRVQVRTECPIVKRRTLYAAALCHI